MSASAPRVSAIVVTYNRCDRLPATLDSILAQTEGDFELVVSDDCSTDGTPEVGARYEQLDARVRYRRNAHNLRMPGNLNAALAEVRGEYVAILHDGDVYHPELFARTTALLDRHPSAGFCFNAYEVLDVDGSSRVDRVEMGECTDGREFLRRIYVPNRWGSPVFGTALVRRSCLDAVGPFDPRYSMHSDIVMWVQLAARYDVAYAPEPLMTLAPHEPGHFLERHFWWILTVDVRAKRLALEVLGSGVLERLAFELRVRLHYFYSCLVPLRHLRFREVGKGLQLAVTGRDEVAPPY